MIKTKKKRKDKKVRVKSQRKNKEEKMREGGREEGPEGTTILWSWVCNNVNLVGVV
jgi:hypothetical protein